MDMETVQTLLALLNPLHGELDEQMYEAKNVGSGPIPEESDEFEVVVTLKQEEDLARAIVILQLITRGEEWRGHEFQGGCRDALQPVKKRNLVG
jgi:hypothetical protein